MGFAAACFLPVLVGDRFVDSMTQSSDHRWLHRFAVITAMATFCLIWVGGLVTSHGAGMAVPDWPTTYGYNMFFFPISKWVGGIFYEHSHRLVASGVGLLTVILCVWLWLKEERRWLRWLGVIALAAVILQGVLGGLRVTQMKDAIGVFHATLAQLFFGLMSAIALFTSRWWLQSDRQKMSVYAAAGLRYSFATVTGLILLQLTLGAAMRHQHAGLAIPDFPLAYGKVWPAMDGESVAGYNQARGELTATNRITSVQIGLQMAHRIVAFLILSSVAWTVGVARRRGGARCALAKLSVTWLALILLQATLGAATIWTNKAADLATAHVAVGALSLMNGVVLVLMAARLAKREPATTVSARAVMEFPQRPAGATS
jgi:cytochrome c oxidase assembly protein subunit 15